MKFFLRYPHPSVASFALGVYSRSRPDLVHDVALMADGFWSCDCEAATLGGAKCDHVRFAVGVLAALRAQVTT